MATLSAGLAGWLGGDPPVTSTAGVSSRISPGRNIAWKDAGNGRLTLDWDATGNPKFNNDEAELIYSLLLESPWFGDPTGKRRSLVPTVKTKDASTPGRLKQYAEDAMQPGIQDGRLRSAIAIVVPAANGYQLTIDYVTADGRESSQSVAVSN